MKRLISLISTHGKSPGQIVKEAWQAFQKYQKVEAQVLRTMSHQKSLEKPQLQPQPKEKMVSSSLPQRLLIPFNLSADEALAAVKAHLRIRQANSSETPATTQPESKLVKRIKKFANPSWTIDNSKQGGAIQITNYPHTRKPEPSLDELIQEFNQESQKQGTWNPNLAPKEGETLVQFFRKIPKNPKNKLQKDINT